MAVSFNSYYLYKKYEKRGDQPWLPVYPETFSIDGDGTMPKVDKLFSDPACYVEPQERWVDTGEYACEEIPLQYRWVTVIGGYECIGTTKMSQEKEQQSNDEGVTWIDVSPLTTRAALPVIEYNSENCGYIPPFEGKYKLTLNDSSIVSAECDSTSAITENEVSYQYSDSVVSAVVGNCVTTIDEYAFYYCTGLTSVRIGSGVTTIGNSAFSGCKSLSSVGPVGSGASVEIPNSLTTIGGSAFARCNSLTNVTIPNSVTTIGTSAFNQCKSLSSVTLSDSVTTIGDSAFEECENLTDVTIGSGVTSIGNEAFLGCFNLNSITCLATTPPTLGSDVFYNTNECPIYVPCESLNTYKSASGWRKYSGRIQANPSCIQYRWTPTGTTCIGYDKYQNNIKEQSIDGGITWTEAIPYEYSASTLIESNSPDCGYVPSRDPKYILSIFDSITVTGFCNDSSTIVYNEIHDHDFDNMYSAVVGDCVTKIGNFAFSGCTHLTSVTLPNTVTKLEMACFGYCYKLSRINIPTGVTSIAGGAFYQCKSLSSVGPVGSGAQIEIPSGVTSIGGRVFKNCFSLFSVEIPTTITTIGESAFGNCDSLASIVIPDGVTSIGNGAFSGCSNLTNVITSDNLKTIVGGAFNSCDLINCTIGSGITSIGAYAFSHNHNLNNITIKAITPPTLGSGAFDDTNNCPIYVPASSVNAYKSASDWSTYTLRIRAIP